jgi:hypothetical protein
VASARFNPSQGPGSGRDHRSQPRVTTSTPAEGQSGRVRMPRGGSSDARRRLPKRLFPVL